MRVIEPVIVTTAMLTASNVPETDHAAWNIGTAYSIGNRVIVAAVHSVYEAIAASTEQDPVTDTGVYWLRIGATNRWKAFDGSLTDQVSKSGSITYSIAPGMLTDAVAFLGLDASAITVTVTDPVDGLIFTETRQIVDNTAVIDWFTYFFEPIDFDTEAIFTGLPGYSGTSIGINVTSGGTTLIGQISLGRDQRLGETNTGSSIGIVDFSRKSRDDFGRTEIVERAFAQTVSFMFSFPPSDARRVQRILSRLRATAAVYFAGEDTSQFGTTVYGFWNDFDIPLTAGLSFATMEVEGLA